MPRKSLVKAETPKKKALKIETKVEPIDSDEIASNGKENNKPNKKTPKKVKLEENSPETKQVVQSPKKKTKKRKSVDPPESPEENESETITKSPAQKKLKKKKGKALKVEDEGQESSDDEVEKEGDLVGEDDVKGSDDEEDEDKEKKAANALRNKELDAEKNARTIFVGNLPKEITKDKLKQLFKKFGAIDTVRLRSAPIADVRVPKKVAVIKKDFHTERSSISARVVFKTEESVQPALKMNGTLVEGHHIRVDQSLKKKEVDQNCAIFLGNLPLSIEDEQLWEVFGTCGKIESVRVVRDKMTGLGRGIGFVNFKKPDSIELALMKSGIKIGKRAIRVNRCANNPKSKRKQRVMRGNDRVARFKKDKKKAARRAGADEIKQNKLAAKNQDNSFQGQKVISGKVAKGPKKEKIDPKKKKVVESLVKSMKKPKKQA